MTAQELANHYYEVLHDLQARKQRIELMIEFIGHAADVLAAEAVRTAQPPLPQEAPRHE